MNQQLLEAIKKRKKQIGGGDQPEEKQIPKSEIIVVHNTEGFKQNKAMLENLFGKKQEAQAPPVQIKKEEPKGDAKNFNNARALLQQNFGKGGENTNVMNIQPTGGLPNLLPPPPPPSLPIGNLPLPPPPPPPPSINLSNLPPPPPPLNIPLPPPPPINLLPPPPFNLPPPPSNLSPPPSNLPPPPPPTLNIPKAPSDLPSQPHINIPNLPPPPSNLPPPPSNIPQSSIHTNQTKPQININFSSHISPQQNLPPPPPPSNISSNIGSSISASTKQQDDAFFILSEGTGKPKPAQKQQNIPTIQAWDEKDLQKSKRKKIFDKKSNKRFPLTQQILGKNIAAIIKEEFVKSVNIPSIIGLEVRKKQYDINFPTIQNKLRAIEPIETLYADTQSLDLVSCFMNKNLNAASAHNKKRDELIANLNNYNWQTDPLKLKPIKEAAQVLPTSTFIEPNFVAIKNATLRCQILMKSLIDNQQFARCDQLKKLMVDTENKLKQYCSNPSQNKNLLHLIEQNVQQMKIATS